MKNIRRNNKIQVKIVYGLMFPAILFFCGCSTASSTPPGTPDNVSVKQIVPEAVGIVQAGLADPDPMIRTNAVEIVAAGRLTKLMPKVSRLTRDEIVPVRFATALAVGDMEYSLGKSDIEQLLKDPDENVRIAAAYAMKKLSPASDIESIRKAIASNDQTVRANAAWLLGKCGSQNDLKLLYWALQNRDSSDKARFVAVEAIAALHDERIYPKILSMLVSGYHDVKVTGIRAMGALGTQNAKDALVTKLDDPILEVRLAAAEQVGALGEATGEAEVLDVFRKNLTVGVGQDDAERIKFHAALAIGRIRTPSLTRFLPELLKDPSKTVRLAAAKAVLQCADRKK